MKYLKTPLEDIPWVRHGFFTRQGGESGGIYASLNCGPGSGDNKDHVRANREKVAAEIGAESVLTLNQVHSATAITVTKPWEGDRPTGDALVTAVAGLGVAALTADCGPVLLASKKDKVVAAAHAGWKGAIGGVLEAAIEEMKKCGARPGDIVAAIGPCIGPASYEVSADFNKPFMELDRDNARFFRKAERPGHLIFDLPGYIAHRLKAAGVAEIHDTRRDTLADAENYFSYRRSTLKKEPDYGRQISVISIK
jgi:YfiH family protein